MTRVAFSNRATNVVYQVYDGLALLGDVTVNQQLAPSGGVTKGEKGSGRNKGVSLGFLDRRLPFRFRGAMA
jgi:hypothetical protein